MKYLTIAAFLTSASFATAEGGQDFVGCIYADQKYSEGAVITTESGSVLTCKYERSVTEDLNFILRWTSS